jgi:hypothetical protein
MSLFLLQVNLSLGFDLMVLISGLLYSRKKMEFAGICIIWVVHINIFGFFLGFQLFILFAWIVHCTPTLDGRWTKLFCEYKYFENYTLAFL